MSENMWGLRDKLKAWLAESREKRRGSHINLTMFLLLSVLASIVSQMLWNPTVSLLGKLVSILGFVVCFIGASISATLIKPQEER
jgi:hypothetical protein